MTLDMSAESRAVLLIISLNQPIELRSEGEGQSEYIEGYALKFEKWSERLGWFKEIISRTALDSADMSNVIALFNHQQDFPLARNTVWA